jgi:hypothetical protein
MGRDQDAPARWVESRATLPVAPPTQLKAGEIAYGAARAVEPCAFFAKALAAPPLSDVRWCYAVGCLAAGVVVVDLGVGRVPRSPTSQAGLGRLPEGIRGPTNQSFVRSHAFPPPLAYRLSSMLLDRVWAKPQGAPPEDLGIVPTSLRFAPGV